MHISTSAPKQETVREEEEEEKEEEQRTEEQKPSKPQPPAVREEEEEEEEGEDKIAPLPTIKPKVSRRFSEERLRLDGLPPPPPSPPLETRVRPHSPKERMSPPITPPKSGDHSLLRIQEKPSSPPSLRASGSTSPVERLMDADTVKVGGVSPTQPRRKSSSGVYSPLMVSTRSPSVQHREKSGGGEGMSEGGKGKEGGGEGREGGERKEGEEEKEGCHGEGGGGKEGKETEGLPTSGQEEEESVEAKRRSFRDERARRQLFAVSADGKIGSRESAYMGWSLQPQVHQIRERREKEEGERVKRRVQTLLRPPLCTGPQVPLEFSALQTRERGKLHIWRQKVRQPSSSMSLPTLSVCPLLVMY